MSTIYDEVARDDRDARRQDPDGSHLARLTTSPNTHTYHAVPVVGCDECYPLTLDELYGMWAGYWERALSVPPTAYDPEVEL